MAALLLVARRFLKELGLSAPSTSDILGATGATRSRAYELSAGLVPMLESLARPVGRPKQPVLQNASEEAACLTQLTQTVLRFLKMHPGAAGPRFYADVFRREILALRAAHLTLDLATFARAVAVPLGTLEDWLRPGSSPKEATEACPSKVAMESTWIQSILHAWRTWRGPFTAFCDHVRHHLRITYGTSLIARILAVHGERTPRRRPGRASDECATRDSFEVYFPGAQWVGDGTQVPVEVNGTCHVFNLEAVVDAFSGAVVGASIRDEEDADAVTQAFSEGTSTTGAPPLAMLLDNRPSNHTDAVQTALAETLIIRSTPGRGQSKAHVEGLFGLFQQDAPPLAVHYQNEHELAAELLRLRLTTWARRLNHRPRKDRDGRSRFELYRHTEPSPEEIEAARESLKALCRKQEKAAQTRRARMDPRVCHLLDQAFERLELIDPKGHLRSATAGFSLNAILDGIAVFEAKKMKGTLPPGVDARYLLGIIRNVEHQHESDAVTQALIQGRLALRDSLLEELRVERTALTEQHLAPQNELLALIDHATQAEPTLDRHYWLLCAADHIKTLPEQQHPDLFQHAARRIHATFKLSPAERYAAERILARSLWPID